MNNKENIKMDLSNILITSYIKLNQKHGQYFKGKILFEKSLRSHI